MLFRLCLHDNKLECERFWFVIDLWYVMPSLILYECKQGLNSSKPLNSCHSFRLLAFAFTSLYVLLKSVLSSFFFFAILFSYALFAIKYCGWHQRAFDLNLEYRALHLICCIHCASKYHPCFVFVTKARARQSNILNST
jgi:hypothetical protein